jgi:enamine deaminase RidA (YjgF/YER057c/UK114 family)
MSIQRHGSGGRFEPILGYSRVVRAGSLVEVSGCTGVDADGAIVGDGDIAEQTRQAIRNVVAALAQAGATPDDVIRTRLYVTDILRWEEAGRAHGEVFGEIRPAMTMVEVSSLIDSAMLVEVEATAYVA